MGKPREWYRFTKITGSKAPSTIFAASPRLAEDKTSKPQRGTKII